MYNILLIHKASPAGSILMTEWAERGFRIDFREKGIEGLLLLNDSSHHGKVHDAVIINPDLPDISLVRILGFIKGIRPDIPVIITGGFKYRDMLNDFFSKNPPVFLENPTAEDLQKYLNNSINGRSVSLRDDPDEVTMAGNEKSGFLFIKIQNRESFSSIFQKLDSLENVLSCHGVKGDYHMILKLRCKSETEMEKNIEMISNMEEIESIVRSDINEPPISRDLANLAYKMNKFLSGSKIHSILKEKSESLPCSAYVLIEAEKNKVETVFKNLFFLEETVIFNCATGAFNIVLMLRASDFDEIHRIIDSKIAGINGVLKIIQCKVVDFIE